MTSEEQKSDCHCHTIRILDHECICCGEKIKKGKILLLDKIKLESDKTLSETVKNQVKKFENVISNTNSLTENNHSFINNKYENVAENYHISNTNIENQNYFVKTAQKNEHISMESLKHTNHIDETNKKYDDNELVIEKRHSLHSNHSAKSKNSTNSKALNEHKITSENIFDNDNSIVEDSETVLSLNDGKIEETNEHHILSTNYETQEYEVTKSTTIKKEMYGSNKSLASSNVSNSTFRSNKSFPAPVPPTRSIYKDKLITENITENSDITYFKNIEENNNIETFEKSSFYQDQYFIEKSIEKDLNKSCFGSSEMSKHKKNSINDIINQNHSSEHVFSHKNISNDCKKNAIDLDILAREVHSDVLLLSKKTELLAELSKNVNSDAADFKHLKENDNFLEKILNEKHTETTNHRAKSTTYYEIENNFERTSEKNLSKDKRPSISSSSDFTSSLKAEVISKDELPNHLIKITQKEYNLTLESLNEIKKDSEEKVHQQMYEEQLSSHFEPSIIGEPIDANNLQKSNSQTFYHSTRTSLFEPLIYGEHIKKENNSGIRNKSRQSNDSRSTLYGIHRKGTPNSNVYGSECEKNIDKLKYWKDKLVQESVIDETYEDLTLYKPKMVESICPITNTKKVIIGGESKINKFKKILLFGLSNSGKTSMVNRICNYLYGTDRSTLLRLVVKFPSELHHKQHEIITYQFNNSLLPYNLIVIDTPGCDGVGDGNQFTYKQLYHNYLKPIVNSQNFFTIDAVLICLRFNSDCFNRNFNHQIKGLKKIINGHLDSNNILSIFTDSDTNYQIEAMKDFHKRQISKYHGIFLIHSKSYLNAKHGFSHLDYIRIFEQSESELFKLFTFLEFEAIPTKLVKGGRSEILV